MGGGAMLPPYTGTVGHSNNSFTTPPPPPPPPPPRPQPQHRESNFHSPRCLSSICNTPFGESWTKNRCIGYGSSYKTLDNGSFDEVDEKGTKGPPYYDSAFGSVPSSWEVEKAFSDLQSFMSGCCAPKEEMDWLEPMQNPNQSTLLPSPGYARFYDAFHMLQNEPAMQRLVCSLACDKAVWEAMMNNKAVQNLQGSLLCAAQEEESQSSIRESDIGCLIVKWIIGITTSKLAELIQSFGSILSEIIKEIFEPANKETPPSELSDLLEEKIRSSFLLSVVLLFIVVVTRTQGV